jgi:hypothetical protein
VFKAHDRFDGFAMPAIQLKELAAAVTIRMNGSVFLPEQLQSDPFAFHLSSEIVEVGHYLAG